MWLALSISSYLPVIGQQYNLTILSLDGPGTGILSVYVPTGPVNTRGK